MTYQPSCRYCGAYHGALCPRVKAYEYYPSDGTPLGGQLKRVEFFTPAELDAKAPLSYGGVTMSDKVTPAVPIVDGLGDVHKTGSVSGACTGENLHNEKILCGRCGKEGHSRYVCPEMVADNRRAAIGYYR